MAFKKILVTGGLGYIGSHTTICLIENGYVPVIVDNLCNSKIEALNRIEKISGVRPLTYIADVRDEEKMEQIFNENKIEYGPALFYIKHYEETKQIGEFIKLHEK